MANLYDTASDAVQRNLRNDAKQVAEHECGLSLSDEAAEAVVRTLLANKKDRGAFYRVPTSTFCKAARKHA